MSVAAPRNQWETRHVGVQARAEVDGRTIHGYAIVFNVLSLDLGGFRERILPEAVDRTIRDGVDVRAYFDHDSSKVLGRRSAGTLTMRKDGYGLRVEIDPPDTTVAKDLIASIRRGDITGMSFRFRTFEDDWHMEDAMPVRDVTDMEIGEVSIVSEPAYPQTDAAVRSLQIFQHTLDTRSRELFEYRLRAAGL